MKVICVYVCMLRYSKTIEWKKVDVLWIPVDGTVKLDHICMSTGFIFTKWIAITGVGIWRTLLGSPTINGHQNPTTDFKLLKFSDKKKC